MKLNLPVSGARDIGIVRRFRKANPAETGAEYRYRQPIHDFYGVDVATAIDSQVLFSTGFGAAFTPTGGTALQKTRWHTNLPQPGGQFPKPNWMMIRGIALSLEPRTLLDDALQFLFQSYVTLTIIDRTYLETHAYKLPSGGGAWAGGSSGVVGNGEPNPNHEFIFGKPGEVVRPQQNFSVTIDPTLATTADGTTALTTAAAAAGGRGISAFIHLDGLFNRMVN